ncbi:hypothetical protein PUN28_007755 [Cardiocondyla obscurior]|uniref:Uncharacterized protein n=1 Tax=Cardiocondyla obscurior TaxID=286306 RepID=A0AAW2FXC0_9HYME
MQDAFPRPSSSSQHWLLQQGCQSGAPSTKVFLWIFHLKQKKLYFISKNDENNRAALQVIYASRQFFKTRIQLNNFKHLVQS